MLPCKAEPGALLSGGGRREEKMLKGKEVLSSSTGGGGGGGGEGGCCDGEGDKRRKRRLNRKCRNPPPSTGEDLDSGAVKSPIEDTIQQHLKRDLDSDGVKPPIEDTIQQLSKSHSAIDDANKSEFILASSSQLYSKEFVSQSIQKLKLKEVIETPRRGHCVGLAEDCEMQFSSTSQSQKEAMGKVSGHSSMPNSLDVTREMPSEHEGVCLLENARSWSGSRLTNAVTGSSAKSNCFPSERSKGCPDMMQKKHFMPYWSAQALNEALETGEAFRAVFRVNAHNRLEGYCTIDGVPTDILINGTSAQNRAIEGDVVAIVIDHVSSWPRLKGSSRKQIMDTVGMNDAANVIPFVELSVTENIEDEVLDKNNCIAGDGDPICDRSMRLVLNDGSRTEEPGQNNIWGLDNQGDDFHRDSVDDQAGNTSASASMASNLEARNLADGDSKHQTLEKFSSYEGQDEVGKAMANLNANLRLHPNKRPTGRVVAIIDESPRRNAVIGFLEIKQNTNKEAKGGCSRNEQYTKLNSKGTSSTSGWSIKLIPTDARFEKMVVFESSLPHHIKKRLLNGDVTLENELVVACVDAWRPENYLPLAVVTQSLGEGGKIETQTAAILIEHAIHTADFHPDSLACLPKLPWKIPSEEFEKRRDLRELCIFSIDPPTARDLDDALSIQRIDNGTMRVGVHIADVSYFVHPETALDVEAQHRSVTVYLIQQVLPMLPRLLCEELCSLNPGVDRLAFSIMWDIDPLGEILDHWIGRTIIHSCCKLSYQHAQEIIDGNFNSSKIMSCQMDWPDLHGSFKWQDIIADIRSLHEIAKRRRNIRFENGALRLDNLKLLFELDNDGMPCESMLYKDKDSNSLIQEFMLLANMTVAKVISRAFPECALLRRHPEPSFRKLKELEFFCIKHGFELDTSSAGQLHLSLEKMQDKLKNDPALFNILVLYATRPMQLAKYFCTGEQRDKENDWAHYALATPLYTHFTSPIRRYPDIVVHRTLAAALEAEEIYFKNLIHTMKTGTQKSLFSDNSNRCFTSLVFDKEAAESEAGRKALAAAALKYKIPGTSELAVVAAHCNERKLACRYVREASDKLYLWALLKRKQKLISDARVLALGPKFMSVYIYKLAMERRIYFDDIEGLIVEWFEATSVLLLNISSGKFLKKRRNNGKYRTLEDIALVVNPANGGSSTAEEETYEDILCEIEGRLRGENLDTEGLGSDIKKLHEKDEIEPAVFPLTLRSLSSVPVSIHAMEGDSMPPEVAVRLYLSSYLR